MHRRMAICALTKAQTRFHVAFPASIRSLGWDASLRLCVSTWPMALSRRSLGIDSVEVLPTTATSRNSTLLTVLIIVIPSPTRISHRFYRRLVCGVSGSGWIR